MKSIVTVAALVVLITSTGCASIIGAIRGRPLSDDERVALANSTSESFSHSAPAPQPVYVPATPAPTSCTGATYGGVTTVNCR